MKTKTLLFILLLVSGMVSAQVKRVAILETVDRENKVSYANKLILRANLSKAITLTAGYEAYDRTDIDAIMGEQNFQRTGLVSNEQIKRLGEMTGANYILVAEAVVVDSKNMFITAKLLDVETARTIMTDNMMMGITADAIQKGCIALAKKMFHDENTNSAVETEKKTLFQKPNKPEKVKKEKVKLVPAEIQLVRNSKTEQKLLGMKKYSYGATQMDEEAFCKFLKNNNREAYLKYMKREQMIYAGWGLLAGGAIIAPVGAALMGWLNADNDKRYSEKGGDTTFYLSIGCMGIGAGALLTSIPIFCVANTKDKRAIKMFNEQNSVQEPELSLNLQASQNGIGLALSF